jgi:hypothetical protein
MSLIVCPECKNQVSSAASACPKCGFPLVEEETVVVTPPPVVEPPVVVRNVRSERKFPNWVFVPVALALAFVVFGFIWLMSENKETANENVNVRIRETASANTRTRNTVANDAPTTVNPPSSADSTVVVPPSTSTGSSSSYPSTVPPSSTSGSSSSSVPSTLPPASSSSTVTTPPPASKGKLAVTATLSKSNGSKTPVRKEKLYLLKEDLDTIMTKAKIEPEDGSYSATLGAAIADPSRKELLDKMLAAIKPYIVASITTDANGKAEFKNIEPDSYYLFGVTKTGNSASVWNTSITINPGDNTISLNGTASDEPTGVADYEDYDNLQ